MSMHTESVLCYGEVFLNEDGKIFKAGVTNTTKAASNYSNRALLFDGLITKGAAVGEYLTREIDGSKHLVETLHPQPKSDELQSIFLAQCNQIIALARENPIGTGGNRDSEWILYAENVYAFKDIITRAMRATNDGLVEQDIISVHIPAKLGVKRIDRVYFVRQGLALKDCEFFRIDSINDSLTPLFDLVDSSGIDILQLTADVRTGEIVNPDVEPDEPTDPNPGGWW